MKTKFLQKFRTLGLKIKKYIVKKERDMNVATCCQPKQETKRKLHRKVFEKTNESKWGKSYESM